MTDKQIAATLKSLMKKRDAARTSYSLARERRKNAGKRIQSLAETKASYRLSDAQSALSTFCSENKIPFTY